MKKNILKLVGLVLLGVVSLFAVSQQGQAAENEMSQIAIHVKLLEDGSGIITEKRSMDIEDGTELYIVLNNLGESELLDFQVSGRTKKENWDIDDSQQEKANYYGIIEKSSGYELVWGIGDYGPNTYELSYTLSNLVHSLEDGQSVLWNFDTFSDVPPAQITLDIEGPVAFTSENTAIWGFGFDGNIQLKDGNIHWQSEKPLTKANYATVLAQFSEAIFSTAVNEQQTLAEQKEEAMKKSEHEESISQLGSILLKILGGVVALAILGVVTFAVLYQRATKKIVKFPSRRQLKKENKEQVLAEVPYQQGDFSEIAYLLQRLYLGSFENYFFAYLLKWANDKQIDIESTTNKKQIGSKGKVSIQITDWQSRKKEREPIDTYLTEVLASQGALTYESVIWQILLNAADENGQITSNKMQKWAEKHGEELEKIEHKVTEYSLQALEMKGLLTVTKLKVMGITQSVVSPTEAGEALLDRLVQFENYLNQINLKEAANVQESLPWEELVIWAAIYGKAEKIVKQLETFFPEKWAEWSQEYPYFYGGFYGYYGFNKSVSKGFDSSGHGASGTGGSTSFGGGGGAGGGGGGGVR